MDKKVLTKEQLAEYLQISTKTVERLVKEGMPHFKIVRQLRFEIDVVLKWLKNRENNKEDPSRQS